MMPIRTVWQPCSHEPPRSAAGRDERGRRLRYWSVIGWLSGGRPRTSKLLADWQLYYDASTNGPQTRGSGATWWGADRGALEWHPAPPDRRAVPVPQGVNSPPRIAP